MGGGQSQNAANNNNNNVYQVKDEKTKGGGETTQNAASQENLIKAQLKARQKKIKDKKVRKVGIKGKTGLDISSTGSPIAEGQQVKKSDDTIKIIKDALQAHFLFHALPQAVIGNAIANMHEVVVEPNARTFLAALIKV